MTSVVASAPMTFLRRVSTIVIGAFAVVALFLALVGIYAVIAESVAMRTKEIGVRMSFGAGRGRIVSLILREGMFLVAIGLGAGLAAAIVFTRFMKSILFGITAHDPLTFAGVAVMLAGTALVAALLPAYRASRVDPMTALRQE
jgi:putative ABC transport system permease protein